LEPARSAERAHDTLARCVMRDAKHLCNLYRRKAGNPVEQQSVAV
jgi:hypothetical protein